MTEIKKKGFVFMYILILIIPAMLISYTLLDLTLMEFKTNINIARKLQAYYNTEAGMSDALKRYPILTYDNFKISIYYITFDKISDKVQFVLLIPNNDNYVKVKIAYKTNNSKKVYTIDTTGHFEGCIQSLEKIISE